MSDCSKNSKVTFQHFAAMSTAGHYCGTMSSQSFSQLKLTRSGNTFEGKGLYANLDGTELDVSHSVCMTVGQGVISVTINFVHGGGTVTCKLDAAQADALAGRESVLFTFVATARRIFSLRTTVCTDEKTPQLLFNLEFVPSE